MKRVYLQQIVGHWEKYLEEIPLSALAFYDAVEAAISERAIPGVMITRVAWPERGLFSSRRYYLQICFEDFVFLVSAIRLGNGTALSWWLGVSERGLRAWFSSSALVGWLFRPVFHPMTFYRVDRMRAFEHALHGAVLAVVDAVSDAKGIRRIDTADRKPLVAEFFDRVV